MLGVSYRSRTANSHNLNNSGRYSFQTASLPEEQDMNTFELKMLAVIVLIALCEFIGPVSKDASAETASYSFAQLDFSADSGQE